MFTKITIGSLLLANALGHLVPCNSSFDVMFLQDTTLSFTDGLKNIFPQIKELVDFARHINPDGRFGLSTFRDKPISPVGEKEDYCFDLKVPFTSDYEVLQNAYETITAGGGGDFPQGHYQGLLASLQLLACEWRPIGTGPGEVGARIVIVLTDSIPHNADDIIEGFPHLPPNDGIVTQDNTQIDCVFKGYPSLDQVLATVKGNHHQYVGFVTPDDNTEVVETWSYINEEVLHQPKVFYQHINKNASDFTEAVLKIVEAVQHYVCEVDAVTTPETFSSQPLSTYPETSSTTVVTETSTTTEYPTTVTTEYPTTTTTEYPTTVTTTTEYPTTTTTTEYPTTVTTEYPTTPMTEYPTTITTEYPTTVTTENPTTPMTEYPTTVTTEYPTTVTTEYPTTITTEYPTTTTTTTEYPTTITTEYPTTVTTEYPSTPMTEYPTTITTEYPTTVTTEYPTTTTTTTEYPTTITTEYPTTITTEYPTTPTTEYPTTPTAEYPTTPTPSSHTTVPTHSTTPTHSGTTNPCPQPCPCRHPCPHNCCKDEVLLKIVGHPIHVDMDIEYDRKH